MQFDRTKHTELVAREAELRGTFAQCAQKLNDLYESDGWEEGGAKHTRYVAEAARHAALEREIGLVSRDRAAMELHQPIPKAERRRKADAPLRRYLMGGVRGLSDDERKNFLANPSDEPQFHGFRLEMADRWQAAQDPVRSDLTSGDGRGGDLVDDETRQDVISRLKDFGSVAQVASRISSNQGNDLMYPYEDSTSQKGALLTAQATELAATTGQGVSFDSVTFKAYTAHSKSIRVTHEMIEDTGFDVVNFVTRTAIRRLGRMWNEYFTTGTGSSQPQGIVVGAKAGKTSAVVDSAIAINYSEIEDLTRTVDSAYRRGEEMGEGGFMGEGMARGFMMSDDMEGHLHQMVDDDGRPLWAPSMRDGTPNRLVGYPLWVNNDMASFAAGQKPLIFGAFGYYHIRTVNSIRLRVYDDSRTAQANLVECLGYSRRDGRYAGAFSSGTTCEAVSALTVGTP